MPPTALATYILAITEFDAMFVIEALNKENVPGPECPWGQWFKYDVDSAKKYAKVFESGELIAITEKIHGCQMKITFIDGQFYVSSKGNYWKKDVEGCVWWNAFHYAVDLKEFLYDHPGYQILGECYGQVQKGYNYGVTKEQRSRFAAFDIVKPDGKYLNVTEFLKLTEEWGIHTVPFIKTNHPYNLDEIKEICEQDSTLCPGQIQEGVIIKPMEERWDRGIGRVMLKLVSNRYYMKD